MISASWTSAPAATCETKTVRDATGSVIGKSFLALDLAVAVASGTPCLRRFHVADKGPVLLFAAEDALHVVRRRLEGICRAAGVDFSQLDVHVITAVSLRLDLHDDRVRLSDTVAALRPRLLVLDPFRPPPPRRRERQR